ncbi:hypothetical protein O2W15_15095 [Modestobacter sp. VKM Ac-2979]|uniref:hypothetical protein n=1 Tax=unclassified Modestobacter TaxID=2643866 RepID=UPI0022AB76B5|nr:MULTISPECIES: hypothetical protein [unclassified Modestobacter]MCZ2812763.1 hypothetical protein [Modestobacter sp. VKM Ac-2979]MCZ2843208.1 hypothetical protein [Modestobacter sp. VKM Ac-2980]
MPGAAWTDPLTPLLGRWRTSGAVLDDDGATTAQITGTDVYELMPGGGWVVHRWVFSADGVRARLRAAADGTSMTASWERSTPAGWVRWMVLDFTALHQPTG